MQNIYKHHEIVTSQGVAKSSEHDGEIKPGDN